MTERETLLKLAVDVGSDPITGSLTGARGDPQAFCGWIELVAGIEAARYNGGGGSDDVTGAPAPEKSLG